jgi:serine/threonine protein kinase
MIGSRKTHEAAVVDPAVDTEAYDSPAPRPRTFPVIPGFEILAGLGHGGMGVVYKAKQIRLNRLVALKMVLAGTQARPQDLARFVDEAEAVATKVNRHEARDNSSTFRNYGGDTCSFSIVWSVADIGPPGALRLA